MGIAQWDDKGITRHVSLEIAVHKRLSLVLVVKPGLAYAISNSSIFSAINFMSMILAKRMPYGVDAYFLLYVRFAKLYAIYMC